ncbi:MAG: hypothetical protein ACP5OG_04400 [Candidatus Nanoarchaeia archaeon]
MKNTALKLTLAGILGLIGSVKIMNVGIAKQKAVNEIIPQRYEEINEELFRLRMKYSNWTIDEIANNSEYQEQLDKYKSLIEEQKPYLNDPKISKAYDSKNTGGLIRLCACGLGVASTMALIPGALCLLEQRKIKNR